MAPRTVDDAIDRGDGDDMIDRGDRDDGAESDRSLGRAVTERWYLWVGATLAVALAGVALTREITGPVDEVVFGLLAVVLVAAAVLRPIQVAWA